MYKIIYTTDGQFIGKEFEMSEDLRIEISDRTIQFENVIIKDDFIILSNSNYIINALKQ